ncbi:MAG: insulinase family protein [Tissierellia bacterium]|nr:insulinase family protein [Tissierellia bacterium]
MKNYLLIEESYLKDTGSQVRVYEHINTGAKVLTLDNEDTNNVFSIGFRTPPIDDTGVAHIVEHSVLSGSRKYKTKEPFMDLIQSSLQTFLNAMTFSDKTIYPVSSRNKKDFMNLMDVYLDSVFFPAMYDVPEIFQQEGWHYEYDKENDILTYNGVVFNEMKGVFSDPDSQVSYAIEKHLHPQSTYGEESGGLPSAIPDLTYENFLSFHKKYYHPSNSYIYLYGNFEKEELLEYIHENYLSQFEKQKIDSFPCTNPPFEEKVYQVERYTADQDTGDNTYYIYSTVLGKSENGKDILLRDVFAQLLVESESGLLKKAFLDKGFGEDVYSQSSSSHPLDFSIVVKNAPKGKMTTFEKIIEDTLKDLVSNGISKKLLESILRKIEFALRKGDGPHQGVIFFIRALNSWLYDHSPVESLRFEDVLEELYQGLNSSFYEDYIRKFFLDNTNTLLMTVEPDEDLEQERNLQEQDKLEKIKSSLTKDELNHIIEIENNLKKFQEKEDSKEAKATIPKLELSDVNPMVTHIPRIEETIGENKILIHPQFTNGINYINIAFPLESYHGEDLPYITLISEFIGRVNTKNYSYDELDTEIFLHTGGISTNPIIVEGKHDKVHRNLMVSLGVLEDKTSKGLELMEEVLLHSIFDNEKRLKDILFMLQSDMESNLLPAGHVIAMERLKSHYNKGAYYKDLISGLDYYFFIRNLLAHWDEEKDTFLKRIKSLYQNLFSSVHAILEFTGQEDSYQNCKHELENFIKILPRVEKEDVAIPFYPQKKKEGFYLPAQVQYISMGYAYPKDTEYKGSMTVLSNLLSTGFLHNEIRAKGGAYGAGIRIGRYHDIATYSYRDPHLQRTLDVYKSISEYVNSLDLKNEDLTPIIIGSMNSFDPLLTPQGKGMLDLQRYITGVSEEDISKNKKEALATTLDDLKSYGKILEDAMTEDNIVIIGNKNAMEEYGDDLELRSLLK